MAVKCVPFAFRFPLIIFTEFVLTLLVKQWAKEKAETNLEKIIVI